MIPSNPFFLLMQLSYSIHVSYIESSFTSFSEDELRRSNMGALGRAKIRTLKMTVIIVATFFFCWTPYNVMSLWWVHRIYQFIKSPFIEFLENIYYCAWKKYISMALFCWTKSIYNHNITPLTIIFFEHKMNLVSKACIEARIFSMEFSLKGHQSRNECRKTTTIYTKMEITCQKSEISLISLLFFICSGTFIGTGSIENQPKK